MSANFQLEFRKSNGNLHLQARGDFDGSAACQLINLLDEQYNDKGRIFIDTQNLCKICPFGCSAFQNKLKISRVPADRLFLKGEKGFEIAPKGSKVIVVDKERRCRCKGNCANCPRPGMKKLN